MGKYPRVKGVKALSGERLLVYFTNDAFKVYDCTPLLEGKAFSPLHDEVLFKCVHAGAGGYGVLWNEAIDLSESELWLHGKTTEKKPQTDVA